MLDVDAMLAVQSRAKKSRVGFSLADTVMYRWTQGESPAHSRPTVYPSTTSSVEVKSSILSP